MDHETRQSTYILVGFLHVVPIGPHLQFIYLFKFVLSDAFCTSHKQRCSDFCRGKRLSKGPGVLRSDRTDQHGPVAFVVGNLFRALGGSAQGHSRGPPKTIPAIGKNAFQ